MPLTTAKPYYLIGIVGCGGDQNSSPESSPSLPLSRSFRAGGAVVAVLAAAAVAIAVAVAAWRCRRCRRCRCRRRHRHAFTVVRRCCRRRRRLCHACHGRFAVYLQAYGLFTARPQRRKGGGSNGGCKAIRTHVAMFTAQGPPRRCLHRGVCTEVSAPRCLHGGACTEVPARRGLHGGACTEGPTRRCLHGSACTEGPPRRCLQRDVCLEESAWRCQGKK